MINKNKTYLLIIIVFITFAVFSFSNYEKSNDDEFVSFIVNSKKQDIKFYWKDDKNQNFKSIENLNNWLDKNNKKLIFAMNGGMYKKDNLPQGLYIENEKLITEIDTTSGNGNFYLKPNGVFYITIDNKSNVCKTEDFKKYKVKFATQSGPMLVADGQINSQFKQGSANLNIRNGVGILPDNKVLFAMSKKEINLYDFANYFKQKGCKNVLYLDGFVSRTYLPEQNWKQLDGNFGVIIGVVKNK